MTRNRTMTASDFRARCFDVLDQVAGRKLESVTITKRGRPVAVVRPAPGAAELPSLFGCMRGTVTFSEGIDIDRPILEQTLGRTRSRRRRRELDR
jgi:prevent-host-death family protein